MANYGLDRYNTDSRVSVPRITDFGVSTLTKSTRNTTGVALASVGAYIVLGWFTVILLALVFGVSFYASRGKR